MNFRISLPSSYCNVINPCAAVWFPYEHDPGGEFRSVVALNVHTSLQKSN